MGSYIYLQDFKPNKDEKLIGLNDDISIVDDCIETIYRYAEDFTLAQRNNYSKWIQTIKTHYNLT
jgi:hypothetical protein